MSEEKIDAIEKSLKRKLPLFFIALFAAACAWVEIASPATTYGGHFVRLAFFGWFSWTICRMLEEVANPPAKETTDDTKKGA